MIFPMFRLALIALLLLAPAAAAAQDFYGTDPATAGAAAADDFYNPVEYMNGAPPPAPSIDMEVTDEYRPDGYYEPYDFNFQRAQNPGTNPDLQPPPGGIPPGPDGAPVTTPDGFPGPGDAGGVPPDVYVPDVAPPTYNEPLQAELESQTFTGPPGGFAPPGYPPPDAPPVTPPPAGPALLPAAPASDTAPVRIMIGPKPARRFMVAHPAFSSAISRAFDLNDEKSWLAMNAELIKIYADLTSDEPSWPEIHEEFDRVNSVLAAFLFSGAFGAKSGLVVKWRERLFLVIGPLSTKIKYARPKKPELAGKVASALGGEVAAVLPDGTHVIRLATLKETLEAMLAELETGRFDRVKTVIDAANSHGEALKKLLVPYVNLVRSKVEQRRETADGENLRRALEILRI